MRMYENQLLLLLASYFENKCSINYAQICGGKQNPQLQINKMILPKSLWNKCSYRTPDSHL